jgi:hypothetical protein
MAELTEVYRVTVIADIVLEKTFVEEFIKLGAKGYTCIHCFGKGRHEIMDDPYTGKSLVHIEVLTQPSLAEAILKFVHQPQFKMYPLIGYMDTVKVYAQDTFA